MRDTKRGEEELTLKYQMLARMQLKVDERGIIRVGAKVEDSDILIGKVTPKGESDPMTEEKLLRAIFGEKAGKSKMHQKG